jgi:hypothetical protein
VLSQCADRNEGGEGTFRGVARMCRESASKRKSRTAWGRRVLRCFGVATLLALDPQDASAVDRCQAAFTAWVKLSDRYVRIVQPSGTDNRSDGRGACIPSEAVRMELLDELIRTRARCAEPSSERDQKPQQAQTMLDINEGFIASLKVCPGGGASAATGWTTKATPTISAPKPVARACLQISHPKQDYYTLTNRHCSGRTVVAVIETRATAGKIQCKAYTIDQALALRSRTDKPHVNHECVLNQDRCSKEHLSQMFPECEW